MPMHPLDNPIRTSLDTLHRGIALRAGPVVRYPPEIAPFLAVRDASEDVSQDIAAILAPGESVYLVGLAPVSVEGATLHAYPELAQMVCDTPLDPVDGPVILPLETDAHREDVLALTALVYPHYFRPRTMDMGRYFGIYEDGRLAAIIGERMGSNEARELSAICTHPDFNGRGYARRLMAFLTNELLAKHLQPFLHVSHENTRAKVMYERVGFRHRRNIGFWSLTRAR
jgi:ribosomal protein S18 acetylase RimI-like enzyme